MYDFMWSHKMRQFYIKKKKTNLKVCAHFHQHECVVVVGCVTFMSYEMVYGESLLSGDGSM